MHQANARHRLIKHLRGRGIHDSRVLNALAVIERERFVPDDLQSAAYDDRALPIGASQTISQPYMVALMTQELSLHGSEKVLEIGTGSGYQAAVLARLCRRVVTVERIEDLSQHAEQLLKSLGIVNVECHVGDGSLGWPDRAPYDRIIVTAGAPSLPQELYQQLADGGRIVIPVGVDSPLTLQVIKRTGSGPIVTNVCECAFVPLIGKQGWPSTSPPL